MQKLENPMHNLEKVTRIEIIDHTKDGEGRVFVKWQDNLNVTLDFQDSGRTLKVFLTDRVMHSAKE